MYARISIILLLVGVTSAISLGQAVKDTQNTLESIHLRSHPAAEPADNPGVLRRAAETDDSCGRYAAPSYVALAAALEKSPERLPELRAALERGLKVAIRDGDSTRAEWLGARLKSAGGGQALSLLSKTPDKSRGSLVIPGGAKALMLAVRGREPGSPERFLAEYARTVLSQHRFMGVSRQEIFKRIQDHFECIQKLEALGTRWGSHVAFSLSARDDASRQRAAEILDLLGWQLEIRDRRVLVSAAEKGPSSGRQITASALGIDELAMQSALQGGGTFDFTITDEAVPVLLDERVWLQRLGKTAYAGGFAEALARNTELAKTYAGLSELDDESIAALISGIGLKDLLERNADNLYYFSSALAVSGGRVLLPGGQTAAAAWSSLVKASPLAPAGFFSSLLRADDGRLLAFFFTLSQLDRAHQQFFTRSQSRMARFYALFKESIGVRNGIAWGTRECPFGDFLSDVPLDRSGRVAFPGGPEPWLIAKGHGSVSATAKMLTQVPKAVVPEVEDDILIRLARTRYTAGRSEHSELDNFLAVARVDSHRAQPLDARTALLLAQQFRRYEPVWPYFSIFTGLGYEEYWQFFLLGERLIGYSRLRANNYLGQLGSLLELLSLLHQSGRIDPARTTELFHLLCSRLGDANEPGEFGAASLDVVWEMLKSAAGRARIEDPDTAMMDLLTSGAAPFRLEWKGRIYEIDTAAVRRSRYQRVLQLQKVTRLGTLFQIYDALRELAARNGSPDEQISRIEAAASDLQVVDIPELLPQIREERENVESFRPRSLGKLTARLRLAASGQGNTAEVARQIMGVLSPQVRLALSGIVYACYLDPEDLLVSEDPLFLRKHQFVMLRLPDKSATLFEAHNLAREQQGGTNLTGSFAGFSLMAGKVAVVAVQQNAGGSEFYAAAQLGSLRATRWDTATDDDLRLTALKIRGAREWIVESALEAEARSSLSQATLGLLSLTRRSHLLRSLEARDWAAVWQSVTLGDLYCLGDEFLSRYLSAPWPSPTLEALRSAAARDTRRPDWLGQDLQEVISCSHPHLVRLAPYERYERFLVPEKLAERASEFKLYVAEFAGRAGIPARALETLAEPLARTVLNYVEPTDHRDWRAILDSFSRLDESMIERVIAKPWSKTGD